MKKRKPRRQKKGPEKQELQKRILESLRRSSKPLAAHELSKKTGAGSGPEFSLALEELRRAGKVSVSKRRMVRLPESPLREKAEVVSLSERFAFARPLSGGEDLFLSADDLQGAMIGDLVVLKNIRESDKGKSAQVERVEKKGRGISTGTAVRTPEGMAVRLDLAVRYDVPLEKRGAEDVREGDKILVSLSRRAKSGELSARFCKKYGRADSAKICADAILDQNGIPTEFPPEVLEEAGRAAAPFSPEDLKGRLDLREKAICTIDGEDAKDLDDAISVSRTKNGFRLGVHIADVSHYVREGGAIDLEARRRGTSVYFADRVVPMLPKELSNGVCSLNAGEDKLTFSALLELGRDGEILSYRFRKSVIRSRVRGVYSEVNRLFSRTADKALREKYAPVVRSLNAARELAGILKARAKSGGTMDLDSSESRFALDENGVCVDVRPRESGEAEEMIEQLMIAANRAAAMLARGRGIPFVYRVHGEPRPERIKALSLLVEALGLSSVPIKKEHPQTGDFARILEEAEKTPARQVVSHQLLRTMEKAKYSTEPTGHFGLALEDYCHFTSPIRRYPDTAVHRILTALLSGEKQMERRFSAYAQEAAEESSLCEIRAMTAERSAESCYMAEYMRAHIGECFDGVVSGVTMRGVFVELSSSAEGFVPADSFPGCRFRFDGMITQTDEISGRKLSIGTPLRIRVAAADVPSGRIDFVPEEENKSRNA